MFIDEIALRDFRNYPSLRLAPGPGLNVFYGDNAQGKTNLLEAVYLCCLGKSHRTSRDGELIRHGQKTAYASVRAQRDDGPPPRGSAAFGERKEADMRFRGGPAPHERADGPRAVRFVFARGPAFGQGRPVAAPAVFGRVAVPASPRILPLPGAVQRPGAPAQRAAQAREYRRIAAGHLRRHALRARGRPWWCSAMPLSAPLRLLRNPCTSASPRGSAF